MMGVALPQYPLRRSVNTFVWERPTSLVIINILYVLYIYAAKLKLVYAE